MEGRRANHRVMLLPPQPFLEIELAHFHDRIGRIVVVRNRVVSIENQIFAGLDQMNLLGLERRIHTLS